MTDPRVRQPVTVGPDRYPPRGAAGRRRPVAGSRTHRGAVRPRTPPAGRYVNEHAGDPDFNRTAAKEARFQHWLSRAEVLLGVSADAVVLALPATPTTEGLVTTELIDGLPARRCGKAAPPSRTIPLTR